MPEVKIDDFALVSPEQLEMAIDTLRILSTNAKTNEQAYAKVMQGHTMHHSLSYEEAKQLAIKTMPALVSALSKNPNQHISLQKMNQTVFPNANATNMIRFVNEAQRQANQSAEFQNQPLFLDWRNLLFNSASLGNKNEALDVKSPKYDQDLAKYTYWHNANRQKDPRARELLNQMMESSYYQNRFFPRVRNIAQDALSNQNRKNIILNNIMPVILPYTTPDQRKKITAEFGFDSDTAFEDNRPPLVKTLPDHEVTSTDQLAQIAYNRAKDLVKYLDDNKITARIAVDDHNTTDLVAYLPDYDNMKVTVYSNDVSCIGNVNTYRNQISISNDSQGYNVPTKMRDGTYRRFNEHIYDANQQDPFSYPSYTILKTMLTPQMALQADTMKGRPQKRLVLQKPADVYLREVAEFNKFKQTDQYKRAMAKYQADLKKYQDDYRLYRQGQLQKRPYHPRSPYNPPLKTMDLFATSSTGSLENVKDMLHRQFEANQVLSLNASATGKTIKADELSDMPDLAANDQQKIVGLDETMNSLSLSGLDELTSDEENDDKAPVKEDSSGEELNTNDELMDDDGQDENNEATLASRIKMAQRTTALDERVNSHSEKDPRDTFATIYDGTDPKTAQKPFKDNFKHAEHPDYQYDFHDMDMMVSQVALRQNLINPVVKRNLKTNVYKVDYQDTNGDKRQIVLGGYIPSEPKKLVENGKLVDNPMAGARKIKYGSTVFGYSVPGLRGFVLGDKDNLRNSLYVADFHKLLRSSIAKQMHDQLLNPQLSQDKRSYTAFDNLYTTEGYSTVIKKSSVNSPKYQQTLIKTLQSRVRLPDSLLSQANELNELVSDKALDAFTGGKNPAEQRENNRIRRELLLYRDQKFKNMPNLDSKDIRQAALYSMNFRTIPAEYHDMVDYEMTGQGKTMGASLFLGDTNDVAIDPKTGQVYPIEKDKDGKPQVEKVEITTDRLDLNHPYEKVMVKGQDGKEHEELKPNYLKTSYMRYKKMPDQERIENQKAGKTVKAALHKLPMFDHTENDPIDRNVMAFNQAIRNIPISKVNVAYMTMSGFTENDAVVVTKKYADSHPQYKADGKPDIMRDEKGQPILETEGKRKGLPKLRHIYKADKVTDFHGNKSTIALVVDPSEKGMAKLNKDLAKAQEKAKDLPKDPLKMNDPQRQNLHNYKYLKAVYRATLIAKANPDLDIIASPYSAISRQNMGSIHEMHDHGGLKNLNDPAKQMSEAEVKQAHDFGIKPEDIHVDQITMGKEYYGVCEGQRADEKTKNYTKADYLKGNSRKFSHQLALACAAAKLPKTLNYAYKNNVNDGYDRLLDDMRILGYDVDKEQNVGRLDYSNSNIRTLKMPDPKVAVKIGHALHYEDSDGKRFDKQTGKEAFKEAKQAYAQVKQNFKNQIYQAYFDAHPEILSQQSEDVQKKFAPSQNKHAKMLAFDLPNGVKYTPMGNDSKANQMRGKQTNKVIVPVAQIFHDIKNQQNIQSDPLARSKWLNDYFDIYAYASGLKLDNQKTNNYTKTGHLKSNFVYNPHKATSKLRDLQNRVLSKDLNSRKNIVKQGVLSSPMPDSSTAVITPDSSLDINTVAVDHETFENLHFKKGEPHEAIIWRDPVLRTGGMRFMHVIEDKTLKHSASVNPANDKSMDMDHDGDTIAVVPVHNEEARKELEKMRPSQQLMNYASKVNGKENEKPENSHASYLETGLEMQGALYKLAQNGDQEAKEFVDPKYQDNNILNSTYCDPKISGQYAGEVVQKVVDKAFDSEAAFSTGQEMLTPSGSFSKKTYFDSLDKMVKSGAKGKNEKDDPKQTHTNSVRDIEKYFDGKRTMEDVYGGMAGLGQKADAIGTAGALQQTLATIFHNNPEMMNHALDATWGTTQLATKKTKTYKKALNVMRATMITSRDAFDGNTLKVVRNMKTGQVEAKNSKISPTEFKDNLKSTYKDLGVDINDKTIDVIADKLTTTDRTGQHIMTSGERMQKASTLDNLAYSGKGALTVLNNAVEQHKKLTAGDPAFTTENMDQQFGNPQKTFSDYVLDNKGRHVMSQAEKDSLKQEREAQKQEQEEERQRQKQEFLAQEVEKQAKDNNPEKVKTTDDEGAFGA